MIDINKEAEEYRSEHPGTMGGGNNIKILNAFIAGHNSKATKARVIQGQIAVLKEVDFNMYMLLKNEAINLDLAEVDVIYIWNKTKWHLEIDKKIKELQQQLKELENE